MADGVRPRRSYAGAHLSLLLLCGVGVDVADVVGLGKLLPTGKARLRAWLTDVLRYPEHIDAFATELEDLLVWKLSDEDPLDVYLPEAQVIQGKSRRFKLTDGEYIAPTTLEDDDCSGATNSHYWKDLSGEDVALYAAAAIVLSEYGVGFVVDPEEQAELMFAVRSMPLPLKFQDVLGEGARRAWRRYGKNAERYQAALIALHVFARQNSVDFDASWSRVFVILSGDLSRLKFSITFSEPRLTAEHPDFPPTENQRQAFERRLSAWRLAEYKALCAAREAEDPALNGKPESLLVSPRPELESSFSWWSLQLDKVVQSKLRDTPAYVEVADELADRCMKFIPLAQQQARKDRNGDRFGTVENTSLPKYARWLLARGLPEQAATVCRMALDNRIESKSPGAFERELARAEKRLALKAKISDE